ncbi:MAG: Rid family hydrolase [Bacteroides sp.]|nr:Rid family hydrolase [Roseburia sp.]MCM1346612.1 Rid family hydrolase [Bacteroides sp.]MCM1421144.1 Rid family hydrolase [Bacteroides sp.]
METKKIYWDDLGVTAELSEYTPSGKIEEYHIMLHVEPRKELFEGQLARIYLAEDRVSLLDELKDSSVILKRYFLSDSTNQQPIMKKEPDCAISIIQQPPLDGSKIAVWIYLQKGSKVANENGMIVCEHNGYRHLWKMGMHEHKGDSAWQTESLLISYEEALQYFNATLADNCIRTWFFVRDVDTQYAGMVKARKENFEEQGLTEKTHYISSTGIGGLPADTRALVQMGTYAVTGFEKEQERYLYAPTHLNPTYEYGVTFERGTLMEYGDRAHVFISGTASINNKGEVLHIGDIVKQTERMWENVDKLLEEANVTFGDVMQMIVYLRDAADYQTVKEMFEKRFPDTPHVITLAPVCRPTWLIEMECIAVAERNNPQFRDF